MHSLTPRRSLGDSSSFVVDHAPDCKRCWTGGGNGTAGKKWKDWHSVPCPTCREIVLASGDCVLFFGDPAARVAHGNMGTRANTAPPGLPPGFGVSAAPPGLPPGLAGFPAAPKLPRDPLAAFLDGAGMGRYLGLFRAEEIRTLEDFRLLTAQDLHDIGLPPHDAAVLHQRTAAHYLANGL